jgi:hypothetical protein
MVLQACFNIYVEICIEIELKHAKKVETDKTEEAIKNQIYKNYKQD